MAEKKETEKKKEAAPKTEKTKSSGKREKGALPNSVKVAAAGEVKISPEGQIRLKAHYDKVVVPSLIKQFSFGNAMEVPRLSKIVVNCAVKEAVGNPKVLGIGLGEDTGLLITNGRQMEAIGSGLVILVDGREIKDTNLTEVELGQPISISHLVTHVMSKFDTFNLDTYKMTIKSSQYV